MGDKRTRHGLPARQTERRLVKLATDAALRDSANPERVGCPGPEAIEAVVCRRHSFPDFDNVVDHISTCTPCFSEYSRQQSRRRLRRKGVIVFACATTVLVGLYVTHPVSKKPRSEITASRETPPIPTLATLDYTAWTAVRSENPQARPVSPPKLPRVRLELTIRLPIGTEDGPYTVEFRSGRDEAVVQATGHANWDGTAEVLKVSADLTRATPGLCTLTIRSGDSSQRSYPVVME
jgi:hypothetical protein